MMADLESRRRKGSGGRLPWLVLGLVVIVLLSGFMVFLKIGGHETARSPYEGKATLAQLQVLPETNLFYPNSEIVVRLGRQDGGIFAGRNPSNAGYELGANESQEDLLIFYTQELQARGWQPLGGLYSTSSTAEQIARSWQKDDRIFRFAVREKDNPLGPPPDIAARYSTIYTIQIRDLNSDGR